MRLLLYDNVADRKPSEVIRFDPDTDRWGDIWSVYVPGIGPEDMQQALARLAD